MTCDSNDMGGEPTVTIVPGGLDEHDQLAEIDSILANSSLTFGDSAHATERRGDALFTWDYDRSRDGLVRLYEKAKRSQWNASDDLDWSIEVDPEAVATQMGLNGPGPARSLMATIDGSPVARWDESHWTQFRIETLNWRLSQFLHGEQGALVCSAKIVETVPWIDAKYYAATQVYDEARHVEVFARYLDEKLDGHFPVNPELQLLIDDVLRDDRWDITYMGMQVMIEGLALAAFGFMHMITDEPLLKKLLRYVMADEARHVAFGVLSLQEYYQELSAAEIRERQEFAFEAALRMRDRLLMVQVWDRMEVPQPIIREFLRRLREGEAWFQAPLFSKIVPNCKKLGLLDAGDGWLRERFTEIGVIHFENDGDARLDVELLDAVTLDRLSSN
jgi:hypothetical protein